MRRQVVCDFSQRKFLMRSVRHAAEVTLSHTGTQADVSHDTMRIRNSKFAGTSSFGMSGVNCHVLVTPPVTDIPVESDKAYPWTRILLWAVPRPHALLTSFKLINRVAEITSCLGAAAAAFLWDHRCVAKSHLLAVPWSFSSCTHHKSTALIMLV